MHQILSWSQQLIAEYCENVKYHMHFPRSTHANSENLAAEFIDELTKFMRTSCALQAKLGLRQAHSTIINEFATADELKTSCIMRQYSPFPMICMRYETPTNPGRSKIFSPDSFLEWRVDTQEPQRFFLIPPSDASVPTLRLRFRAEQDTLASKDIYLGELDAKVKYFMYGSLGTPGSLAQRRDEASILELAYSLK